MDSLIRDSEYIVIRAVYGRENILLPSAGGYYEFRAYKGSLGIGRIEMYGNLTSLIDGTNRTNGVITGYGNGYESHLFRNNTVSRIPDIIASDVHGDALFRICLNNTSLTKPCKIKLGGIGVGESSLPHENLREMFKGCTGIVLNNEQGGTPWRIEIDDISELEGRNVFKDMFSETSGTMNGTPEPNKTYYIAS